jgi:hypothetical protein
MFEERIALGIATLDEVYGTPTWVQHVDLEKLQMRSADWCVLGQLGGFFGAWREVLNLDNPDAPDDLAGQYGFDLTAGMSEAICSRYRAIGPMNGRLLGQLVWNRLDLEWRRAIAQRLADLVAVKLSTRGTGRNPVIPV